MLNQQEVFRDQFLQKARKVTEMKHLQAMVRQAKISGQSGSEMWNSRKQRQKSRDSNERLR